MTNQLIIVFILTTLFSSCSNQHAEENKQVIYDVQKADTIKYKGLNGTWIRQNKAGFTLIEIKDTSNVLYYQFIDREIEFGKPTVDRFWYYKSNAKMGYWDSTSIWISTDIFRFDYKLKSDTLIEYDKMGYQGTFIKVETDKEKAYRDFNTANLKGRLKNVSTDASSEYFVLDNIDGEYSFTSTASKETRGKTFSLVAEIGDSITKSPFADTLTLYKRNKKEYYKFSFIRQ